MRSPLLRGTCQHSLTSVLSAEWPHHYILRSSIIFGPPPPFAPVTRSLFLQWLDGALAAGSVNLFEDEYRTPTYVDDLCVLCAALVGGVAESEERTFNVGGPERLSRAQMGDAVAAVRGYEREHVRRVPAASAARTFATPVDISMDSALLEKTFPGAQVTPFAQALVAIFSSDVN